MKANETSKSGRCGSGGGAERKMRGFVERICMYSTKAILPEKGCVLSRSEPGPPGDEGS